MSQNEIWTCRVKFRKNQDFWKIHVHQKFYSTCPNFILTHYSEFLIFFHDFLCKMKLKIHIFNIKSFLPPSLVFYPFFFHMKCRQKQEKSKFQKSTQRSMLKNWGKKLVRGVKNFWFWKYESSAFFCTKNN